MFAISAEEGVFCFNTQPPEGGWVRRGKAVERVSQFQHTAARRRLAKPTPTKRQTQAFQHTAARRRLVNSLGSYSSIARFNTQPPEGGWRTAADKLFGEHVSTHSRPKAAGASLKSLAPSGFAAPISLGSQEKRERKYNTAFSVTPAFAIS